MLHKYGFKTQLDTTFQQLHSTSNRKSHQYRMIANSPSKMSNKKAFIITNLSVAFQF